MRSAHVLVPATLSGHDHPHHEEVASCSATASTCCVLANRAASSGEPESDGADVDAAGLNSSSPHTTVQQQFKIQYHKTKYLPLASSHCLLTVQISKCSFKTNVLASHVTSRVPVRRQARNLHSRALVTWGYIPLLTVINIRPKQSEKKDPRYIEGRVVGISAKPFLKLCLPISCISTLHHSPVSSEYHMNIDFIVTVPVKTEHYLETGK